MKFGRLLFILIFFMFWFTTTPFVDLRNPDILLAQESGSFFQQFSTLVLMALCIPVLWERRKLVFKVLFPALACVLFWQFLTVLFSTQPDISFRRFIFSLTVIMAGITWMLLPDSEAQFSVSLRRLLLLILGAAYFGVIFWPEVSIHNFAEVLELSNAGSWRGHFVHKNIAGSAMVIMIIYGLYIMRVDSLRSGLLIVALALVFLYNTNSKTSLGLTVIAIIMSVAISHSRSFLVKALIAYIPMVTMALLTIGTVIVPSLHDFMATILPDATYTGRVDIWKFALSQLADRPLMGYGYEAFWATSRLVNGGYDLETWAATAGHAHNGFLNLAVTTGLIGVATLVWFLVWCPLRDFHRGQMSGNSPRLGLMYLQVWIFMMLYANLESPFFVTRGPIWFALLTAIIGLRLHAYGSQKQPILTQHTSQAVAPGTHY